MSLSKQLPDKSSPPAPPAGGTLSRRALARLDRFMAASPWYPRAAPYFLYVAVLPAIWYFARLLPAAFIPLYLVQYGLVVWLLLRYRKHLPELNLRFHWLAIPTGIGLCVVWVLLGHGMDHLAPGWFGKSNEGRILEHMGVGSPLFVASVAMEYLGMSLIVPLFEELLMRSAVLRGTHSARQTGIGLLQWLVDFPLLGDWLMETRLGRWVTAQPAAFTRMLESTPLGRITVFSVLVSSVVFALGHAPRDWPGAIVCGITWCVLLWYTNRGHTRRGLGPVVWSHGLTNALLLTYVLCTHDWQFV